MSPGADAPLFSHLIVQQPTGKAPSDLAARMNTNPFLQAITFDRQEELTDAS